MAAIWTATPVWITVSPMARCSAPWDASYNVSNRYYCGDGTINPGEECDDGNRNNEDACRNNCTWQCESRSECSDGESCTVDRCINHVCDYSQEVDDVRGR